MTIALILILFLIIGIAIPNRNRNKLIRNIIINFSVAGLIIFVIIKSLPHVSGSTVQVVMEYLALLTLAGYAGYLIFLGIEYIASIAIPGEEKFINVVNVGKYSKSELYLDWIDEKDIKHREYCSQKTYDLLTPILETKDNILVKVLYHKESGVVEKVLGLK